MGSYPNFIDRSPAGLVDALCSRIEKALESFWQKSEFKDEEFHIPHVHPQYLPVSKTESEERDKKKDHPYVQVVCVNGTLSDFHPAVNGSVMTIQVYFNAWSEDSDNQGWRIPANMMWRAMQDLLGDKIVGGYFLEAPIKWTPLNSEDPPYYTAMMETRWKGSPPAFETPFMGAADPGFGSSGENFVSR